MFFCDIKGKCMAHDQNPKTAGTELIETKDADGKYILKKSVESAWRESLTVEENERDGKPLN
ncbi:MAG: cache domain-containing protein [Nitrospiraceae bacterium]|nr:cache domain-containing protein [Nitrospiraceae bacterium]